MILTNMADINLARHCFIEASAGTGKTYTIEQIYVRILAERRARVSEILVVTYTEKAAAELRKRIRENLDDAFKKSGNTTLQDAIHEFDGAAIYTIHGFCNVVLRQYGVDLGYTLNAELVDDVLLIKEFAIQIYRSWVDKFKADLPQRLKTVQFGEQFTDSMKEFYFLLRSAREVEFRPSPPNEPSIEDEFFANFWQLECAKDLIRLMDSYKERTGKISYDDMIIRLRNGLRKSPSVLDSVRRSYHFGIIDEFQDTDTAQWEIFKLIFLDYPSNHLVLVGDPKQAIYSFRGGDIYQYLEARARYQTMKGSAELYTLNTNRRSVPALIESLNTFFSETQWFKGQIDYVPSVAPEIPRIVYADSSQRPDVNFVDYSKTDGAKAVNFANLDFITNEIHSLVSSQTITITEKGQTRPLDYGDFCVLFRAKRNIQLLEKRFANKGIPFTVYKKPGLYSSRESFEILCLLKAIENPADLSTLKKALFTGMFRIPFDDLGKAESILPDHEIKRIFARWKDYANRREWAMLAHSMLRESLAYLPIASDDPTYERRITNYEQILDDLSHEAIRNALDLHSVIFLLEKLHLLKSKEDEERFLHRVESDEKRVKIMTIHASKGLEFAIVFIGDGMTAFGGFDKPPHRFHELDGFMYRKVYDMTANAQSSKAAKSQRDEEDRRLYYVAFTRAALKLYIPFVQANAIKAGFRGLWTDTLKSFSFQKLIDKKMKHNIIDPSSFPVPISSVETSQKRSESLKVKSFEIQSPPDDLQKRLERVYSYSGLRKHKAANSFGETAIDMDASSVIKSHDEQTKLVGTKAGELFHHILEEIDFSDFSKSSQGGIDSFDSLNSENRRVFDQYTQNYVATENEKIEILSVIGKALRTNISTLKSSLSEIPKQDRIHEMEFFARANLPDSVVKEWGLEVSGGFIRGFIDLVFRKDSKFYVADWKSNFLTSYSEEDLKDEMIKHDYFLQARIYEDAVRRFLREKNLEKYFGGSFYFFLRGMDGVSESSGCLFIPPVGR